MLVREKVPKPDCSGPHKQRPQSPPRWYDSEYAPIRNRYVPPWLPFKLERAFLARLNAALTRAKARRRGRWRNGLDEVLTLGRILGGLTSAYKYGRVTSAWGRRMRAKKGQKALQTKLAMEGEMVVDYFARLGKRGGLAKARRRREAYVTTLPPEQRLIYSHQQAGLSGQHRPTRAKSWLEL